MGAVEEVIDYRALLNGWQRVFSNGGMAGMDGISLSDFARNVDAELASLARAVRAGDYRPGPLKTAELQRYGRRPRILAVPSVRDRVLHTAIANWLMPRLEPHFERCSYGYRPGRSYLDAVAEVCRHRDQGLRWVVDADIAQYFDQINQQLLLEELARLIPDQPLLQLIRLSLFGEQGRVPPLAFGSGPGLGLPQGSPLSPLLANLYLDPFDDAMLAAGHALVRYADDFLVMCRNQAGALAVHGQVAGLLAARGLRLNEDKTRITNFELGFAFLGHNFVADMVFDDRSQRPFDAGEWRQRSGEPRGHSRHWGWQPPAATIQPSPPAVQPLWAEAADTGLATAEQAVDDGEPLLADEPADDASDDVELLPPTAALAALQAAIDDEEPPSPLPLPVNGYARLHTLYVARQGAVVGRRGNQFHITLKGELVQKVPANNLDAVCLLGRIQVTRDAMTHCLLNGIAVIFATHNGQYLGQLDNSTLLKTSLISRQVAHSSEPATRLAIAQPLVAAKLANSASLLRRWARAAAPELATQMADATTQLQRLKALALRAGHLNRLRGLEGMGARIYFAAFFASLPEMWRPTGRNRRPPQDPVNALLSLGYTVLFGQTQALVRARGLLPQFGYLHGGSDGQPALVLDLIEPYRALAVDATVRRLLLGRRLLPEHFQQGADGCTLTSDGRRLFIAALEQRLQGREGEQPGAAQRDLRRWLDSDILSLKRRINGELTRDEETGPWQPLILH